MRRRSKTRGGYLGGNIPDSEMSSGGKLKAAGRAQERDTDGKEKKVLVRQWSAYEEEKEREDQTSKFSPTALLHFKLADNRGVEK